MLEALEQAGVEVQSTEQSMLPKTTVEVEADDARKLLRLLDALDEQDDVDQVHANFDMRADVMEEAGGRLVSWQRSGSAGRGRRGGA